MCFSNFSESPVFLGCSAWGYEKSFDLCVASMTDTGPVLCRHFSPVQECLSLLLGIQLKYFLCLICAWKLSWDTGKEWRFTYHIRLWSMWSPFSTAHGKAFSTHHSWGYRSFALLPFQPFQTAWHGSCTYPHSILRCNVNIYKPILNKKQPCCGSTAVCADYSILWKRH